MPKLSSKMLPNAKTIPNHEITEPLNLTVMWKTLSKLSELRCRVGHIDHLLL